MEINIFDDPRLVPQPRNLVRIEHLEATPYPDRTRVHLDVRVTPFQERPNLLITARDEAGAIVAELNIIATMHPHMEFTMHLRGKSDTTGDYSLSVELFYETRNPPQDTRIAHFHIPPESPTEDE